MKPIAYLLTLFFLSSCATVSKPPTVAQIKFVSMEVAKVKDAVMMGDYSYNEFDVPGYKIHFESNQKIISKFGEDSFLSLDYFECNSPKRFPEGHSFSAKDYFSFTSSRADMVEHKSNEAVIYEAQLVTDSLRIVKQPICAQIWINGKTKRKVWQPSFMSNKIELKFPSDIMDYSRTPYEGISKAE